MPGRDPSREPVAIIGIGALYPEADTAEAVWERIAHRQPVLREDSSTWTARIRAFQPSYGRFGIPPAQGPSQATLQAMVLETVDRALTDAGYAKRAFDRNRTDVYCGTCFGLDRAFTNALRVEAGRFVAEVARELPGLPAQVFDDLRRAYEKQFAASPHDRPGEMASTIAGRVTMAFKLHGRSVVVESADATSLVAIREAVLGLRASACDVAIVVAGQRIESGLVREALDAKGLLADEPGSPFDRERRGFLLGEGVGAVVLKRLSSAVHDGDRVYAVITGVAAQHAPQAGSFRYPSNVQTRVASLLAACADAGAPPSSLQYIECFGAGDTGLEVEALRRAIGPVDRAIALGCIKELFGHTMANAGVLALTKVALALEQRLLPGQPSPAEPIPLAPFTLPAEAAAWPAGVDAPRRAAIGACSLTGTSWHLVVEEYDARRAVRIEPATRPPTPIAIVGFGARLAEARDAEAFWDNVSHKRETLKRLPADRLDRDVYFDPANPDLLKSYCEIGSTIEDTEIDRGRFTMPPRRISYMDPVQRVALTVADEAMRRLGTRLSGTGAVWFATNLSLGAERQANTWLAYHELERTFETWQGPPELDPEQRRRVLQAVRERCRRDERSLCGLSLDGYLASGVAAVIANELKLQAPPVAVEAACASSFGALDAAVRGLAERQYDFAITGGIELPVTTRDLVLCSSLGLLSPRRIAPFDAAADGFTIGEAAVAFVLKRHEDAVRDGDPVFAVIRSIGVSSDAKSLIAPDVDGQALALSRAFEGVDFGPETIQYVEAHGTGTALGDPTEIRALARVYGNGKRAAPLAISSAKSMVGHTFAAAGAVGLLRTVLAMRARTLPPSTHIATLNPKLPLGEIPAYIPTDVAPWPAASPRRAAVSAFGTGGMNYHVLIEDGER
jgi:acyl transferase domain-containing protein